MTATLTLATFCDNTRGDKSWFLSVLYIPCQDIHYL